MIQMIGKRIQDFDLRFGQPHFINLKPSSAKEAKEEIFAKFYETWPDRFWD